MKPRLIGTRHPDLETLDEDSAPLPVLETAGDFDLLSVLGEGGGGRVYLARQRSLSRVVALKVVADSGAEANTLAQLEHDHIVRVFSETVDREKAQRHICMQYVAGTTLQRVMTQLQRGGSEATGAAILGAIDALAVGETALEPDLLKEREQLASSDAIIAACRIGAALARALAHAHHRGVVHRDIKPGNIVLTPYGRPLLVDFNLAASASSSAEPRLGGTPRYAAPEQLAALTGSASRTAAADPRSDLYSLGLVVFELLAGKAPFAAPSPGAPVVEHHAARIGKLARLRRSERASYALDRVLRRCLAADPAARYPSADALAEAFDACAALRTFERELPPAGPITRAAERSPVSSIVLAGVIPNILASTVSVSYNAAFFAQALNAVQAKAFIEGIILYNLIVYPAAVAWIVFQLWTLPRLVRRIWRGAADEGGAVDARRRILRIPRWVSIASFLGWTVGIGFFPWFIGWRAEPVELATCLHLALSLVLSAIIAFTYAAILMFHVALRVAVPWVTGDGRDLAVLSDVAGLPARLKALQVIASGVPPIAAVLLLAFSPDPLGPSLRALVISLLGVGVLGFTVVTHFAGEATRSAEALERMRARIAR
jgi:serine/threonine protein kinase